MSDTTATSDEDTTEVEVDIENNTSEENVYNPYVADTSKMVIRIQNENPYSNNGKRRPYSYQCTVCKKVLANKVLLIDHYYSVHLHHKRHACKKCDMKFVNQSALCLHDRSKHRSNKISPKKRKKKVRVRAATSSHPTAVEIKHEEIKITTKKKKKNNPIKNKDYLGNKGKCKYCDRKFRWHSNLVQHERRSHPEVFKNSQFKCQLCKVGFMLERTYKAHMTRVHKITPILCSLCGDIFRTIQEEATHRENSVGHNCTLCKTTFGCKCKLTQHQISYFEDVKCCGCPEDNFRNQFVLWKHTRKLHDLPVLMCCDKSYMRIKTFQAHKRLVHFNNN